MTPSTMNASVPMRDLGAIVVTYHPALQSVEALLGALPGDVRVVVVDNASSAADVAQIEQLLAARNGALLVRNAQNRGLAAAINQGAAAFGDQAPEFLLLLDQDSVPRPGAVAALLEALLQLEAGGDEVGCVGPRLIDPATGLEHGFHAIRGLRWVRIFPKPGERRPVRCANLNGSGTLLRSRVFMTLGGLDDGLFIDHVDTDWSFRVLDAGMTLFGVPGAVFDHSMGERGLRFWLLGWRVWPMRSPARHYFLFRNAVRLLRRRHVPLVWKAWATVKLVATLLIHVMFDDKRWPQAKNMMKGLKAGLGG